MDEVRSCVGNQTIGAKFNDLIYGAVSDDRFCVILTGEVAKEQMIIFSKMTGSSS